MLLPWKSSICMCGMAIRARSLSNMISQSRLGDNSLKFATCLPRLKVVLEASFLIITPIWTGTQGLCKIST